jgi:hypothetical protein
MLKSQGIEAVPDSSPPFQVSICARRRPQLNTLRVNTQTGGPPVPWPTLCLVRQAARSRTPALQQEPRRRRGLYRSVEAAMASCGCWNVSEHREREGRRVRERSRRSGHGDGRSDGLRATTTSSSTGRCSPATTTCEQTHPHYAHRQQQQHRQAPPLLPAEAA